MSVPKSHSKKLRIFQSSFSIKSKSVRRIHSVKHEFYTSLKSNLYKKDDKIYNRNLLILNFIKNCSQKKYSAKTCLTYSSLETFNYDLTMINKYEENLNSSLGFISDFDLENDYENNDSFNSEKDEDSFEEIDIKTKYSKTIENYINDDDEFNNKLNKDFVDIKNCILNSDVKRI